MGSVVALGDADALDAFVLVGVPVVRAIAPDDVRAAWAGLADDVALVILSAAAATALDDVRHARPDVMTAVLP